MNNNDVSIFFDKENNNHKKTRKERKIEKEIENKQVERNERELKEYNKIKSSLNEKTEIIPKKIDNLERTQYKDLKKSEIKKELVTISEVKAENINNDEIKEKKHPLLFLGNAFCYFILVISFLTSIGNIIYIYLYNKSNNNLINAGLLIGISFFYLLSNAFKNSKAKKFANIITSLFVMGLMAFNFFIA